MKISRPTFTRPADWILTAAVAVAGAVGVKVALQGLWKRPLPPSSGRIQVEGLQNPVEIIRDKWGVPHIYAQSEQDLFFAQGYTHAQDRLFQMDINRRLGAGRISELVGPSGLGSDRFARFMGWPQVAAAHAATLDAVTADIAKAFSAGVNTYIAQGKLPVEFTLLAYKPEPWSYFDTVAWGAVLAWGLSVNWEGELDRLMLLEALGPEKAADLTPSYTGNYQTILPATAVGARMAVRMKAAFQQAFADLPLTYVPTGHGIGSNNWVVSGDHTQSGRPILANDPHLPPFCPAFWYENHLVGAGYDVTGFTLPGVPGVVIGHNEHVAWGVTNAFPDVQDIFVERFDPQNCVRYEVDGRWFDADVVTEEIKVRGRKTVVEQVRYTRNGPVFSDMFAEESRDLSLRWAAYGRNNHLRAVIETNQAANWQEFRNGLRCWGFPSQNVVYADAAGNIGYQMPGLVPLRKNGDGMLPVPGWAEAYDWVGWIPFDEMPKLYNPPSGRIVTANNRVHGSDYPYLLTSEWLAGYRAQRIDSLLCETSVGTLRDHGRIQFDTVSLQARRFLKAALPAAAENPDPVLRYALELLQDWDGDMHPDLVAPSLYFGWQVHFSQACLVQAVGGELAQELLPHREEVDLLNYPFHGIVLDLALNWLDNGPPHWVGSVRPLLIPALKKTIAVLATEFGDDPNGWQWGVLHRIELKHPLTRIPVLGQLWKPRTIPIGGDGYTVNQADVSPHFPPDPVNIIASCRMLLDVGSWDNCLSALPGGQSGQPASPYFQDGLEDWRNGRYHPMLFSREKIETAAVGWLILSPPTLA